MIELIKQIIEQDGLANKNRKREIIHRRIYLFNQLRKTGHTLQEIANLFKMNHATVYHGLNTFKNLTETNDKYLEHDTQYYELLFRLNKPDVDLINEIRLATNLRELRKIQARIKNNLF